MKLKGKMKNVIIRHQVEWLHLLLVRQGPICPFIFESSFVFIPKFFRSAYGVETGILRYLRYPHLLTPILYVYTC